MKIDWMKWAKMEAESGQGIYFKNSNSDGLFEVIVQKWYDMVRFW